jgi:type I restriction enzyme S subunit
LQVTNKSYVDSGYVAYSATGADGFLPYFDYDSDGIIVSAIGANCGRIFRASGKWSCIKNTMRILPKNSSILIDYLFHYLSDSTIFPKRGSGQPFIGQQDAREIAISFPSVAEQQKIIDFVEYSLSRLDSSMKLAEQMENQAVVLRRSLLQAAFTGQLTKEVISV